VFALLNINGRGFVFRLLLEVMEVSSIPTYGKIPLIRF
jgi:hypothetical protein